MFGVFALHLKAIYFIVLEDLISQRQFDLLFIQPLKLLVNFRTNYDRLFFLFKNWYLKVATNFCGMAHHS